MFKGTDQKYPFMLKEFKFIMFKNEKEQLYMVDDESKKDRDTKVNKGEYDSLKSLIDKYSEYLSYT